MRIHQWRKGFLKNSGAGDVRSKHIGNIGWRPGWLSLYWCFEISQEVWFDVRGKVVRRDSMTRLSLKVCVCLPWDDLAVDLTDGKCPGEGRTPAQRYTQTAHKHKLDLHRLSCHWKYWVETEKSPKLMKKIYESLSSHSQTKKSIYQVKMPTASWRWVMLTII